MRWEDERYVRVYTRDTPDWLCLSFLAQGLFCLLLRKVDRAGLLPLGRVGRKGVAVSIGHAHQWTLLEPALDELLADGCIEMRPDGFGGEVLVVRNFIEAQEAEASDRARAKKHREKVRDLARAATVTQTPDEPKPVTQASQPVTERHADPEVRDGSVTKRDGPVTGRVATVTPSRAVPCRTDPTEEAAAADDYRRPLVIEDLSGPRPEPPPSPVETFRRRLAESLARTAPHPVGGGKDVLDSVTRALEVVPMADAVELCRARVLDAVSRGQRQPQTLKLFAAILADEVTARRAGQANRPRRAVGVDDNGQPIFAEGK